MTVRIGITGHQDLPRNAERLLRETLRALATQSGPIVVVCSLAVGTDQFAADEALVGGGQIEVIVPCDNYAGTFDDAARWRYAQFLSAAADQRTLPYPTPSEEAFLAAGLIVVERCEHLLAVWDGQPARGLGGTADVVAYAEQIGRRVTVLWPPGITR